MAKAIATVSGIALAPGISRNGRLYTREAIARAVRRAQDRIAEGRRPIAMYTDHDTRKVTDIAGGLTRIWQDEDGTARYEAAVADTKAGRDIAALADPGPDGKQAILRGLSIKGDWIGRTRRVRADDGRMLDTADDLEIARLDWTTEPGVDNAGVERFVLTGSCTGEDAGPYGITEAAPDAVLTITEDVQEARVTAITEGTAPGLPAGPPAGLREALSAMYGAVEAVEETGTPALSRRDSGLKGGGRVWADPGYQADKKQRYDLSTKANAKAAWSYVSQKDNAAKYTPAQLKRVKGRIRAALGRFGVTVAAESWESRGWTVEPAFEVTEEVAEYIGDPDTCGSYSLSATNGPTTVTVCSYGLAPADIAVILQRACDAAAAALGTLDPDMDGDIDVEGADSGDADGDADELAARIAAAIRGESAEELGALIAEAQENRTATATGAVPTEDPVSAPDAAPQGTEAPVSETTTQEAAGTAAAATFTQADIDAAVERDRAARKARKAAAKAAAAAESAAATGTVTESADDRIARIVEERLAAARAAGTVQETEQQRIDRLVEERLTAERQALAAAGQGPGRKGLVAEHAGAKGGSGEVPPDFPMKDGRMVPMEQWTEAQRKAVGGALQDYVLGDRAVY